jgi:hypothetical protein
VAKKIIIRARLCATGYDLAHKLGNIKSTILCTKADGNCTLFYDQGAVLDLLFSSLNFLL